MHPLLKNRLSKANKFLKLIRSCILIIILSFAIGFFMLNNQIITFKIPISSYVIYMPLPLVFFIAPIILKILKVFLSLLIK